MISDKQLLDYQYYLDRMSMFMKESHGFKDRVKILWSILKSIDDFYNELFGRYNGLDINEEKNTYLNKYIKTNEVVTDETPGAILDGNGNYFVPNVWLDKLGSLFNVNRSITIEISDSFPEIDNLDGTLKYVTLNNEEYYMYIKLMIKKTYFNGTREELAAIYQENDVEENNPYFYYITHCNVSEYVDDNPGEVDIYWINGNDEIFTPTLRYMFLNGLLTIESLGINYNRIIQNITNIFTWIPESVEDGTSLDYTGLSRWCEIDSETGEDIEDDNSTYWG